MRRIAGLALATLLASPLFAAEDVIRRGFHVAEGGTLRLTAGSGSVKIVTGGTGVAVEITRTARGRRGEERLREHRITVEQRGNDVVIEDERRSGWTFRLFEDYRVQWNVRVPARYNVEVATSGGRVELADIGGTTVARTSGGSISTGRLSGDASLRTSGGSIRIAGGTGPIDARTSGGSIHVGDTTGAVKVRTSGGSIHLERIAGAIEAHTSGGGIRIDDARGAVDARTSGGSIRAQISAQPQGDSRLSTSGGSVHVTLAPSVAVELDARGSGGGVFADIPVTVLGTQGRNEIQGTINGGGPKLVLRTSGGGIRIGRLP